MSADSKGTSPTGDNRGLADQSGAMPAETRRTWWFVGIAVACLAVTGLFEVVNRPQEIEEYGKLGEEFYPEFTDPTLATSLSVSVIDPEEVKPLSFSVKQGKSGRWVIPSHHDYPADAADQLAQTASSVIGIKRGAMVTRWPADHARYGVVNPETDSVGVDELEGIGKRLTLRGKDDGVLASYIIGKKVDGEESQYYVRHPDEDETYIAELDISLSTKFSDWVNTDLLDIDNVDVRRVELNDYSFDEIRGTVTGKIQTELSRASSSDDWQMEGLDDETQEVNKDAISDTVNELANLELAGVRPKQPGLTADLKLDRSALGSQRDVDRLQSDLLSRGFLLQPSQSDPETLTLISREGEMSVGTEDGMLYNLHFGRVFTGSEEELEIGLTSDDDSDPSSTDDQEKASDGEQAASDDDSDGDGAEEDEADAGKKPGRYVFVRVAFEPSLLGEKPDPVEPEMPEELKEAEKNDAEEKDSDAAESDSDDESKAESGDKDDAESSEKAEQEQKLQKLRDEFNAAKQKYQDDVGALADYNVKVTKGKEKADELNRRFAQWYYVIPGDSYDKLSLSREDLTQAKEKEEDEAEEGSDAAQPAALQAPMNNADEADSGDNAEEAAPMAKEEPKAEEPKVEETSEEAPKSGSEPEPESADDESKSDSAEEPMAEAEPKSDDAASDTAGDKEPSDDGKGDEEKPKPEPSEEPETSESPEPSEAPESEPEPESGSGETDPAEDEAEKDE